MLPALAETDNATSTAECGATLLALLSAPDYQPPKLPDVALKLVEAARRPGADMGEVLSILERDTMLAAHVLQIAQSAAYARVVPPRSLRDAVMRLGLKMLADIVMEACLGLRVFRARRHEDAMRALQHHSQATAHLSRIVCRTADVPSDGAFLCGLLHDIGKVACLLALEEEVCVLPPDQLHQVIAEIHEQAGGVLAVRWKLPPDVCAVIRGHHASDANGEWSKIGAVIAVADWLAEGFGADSGWPVDAETAMSAAAAIGLTDEDLASAAEQAAELMAHVL